MTPEERYPWPDWLTDFDALTAGDPTDGGEFERVTAYFRQTYRDAPTPPLALQENRNRLSAALGFLRRHLPELVEHEAVIQSSSGEYVVDPKAKWALYVAFNSEPLQALRFDFTVELLLTMMGRNKN